jgi:hypothetical protein
MTYTHKGWIGLCPVYIANPHSASPDIEPRLPFTEWVLHLSLWLFDMIGAMTGTDDGSIAIRITGRLSTERGGKA